LNEQAKNILYVEKGYKNRRDYLQNLADEYDIPIDILMVCADMLGPSEDFDGLIVYLEDDLIKELDFN